MGMVIWLTVKYKFKKTVKWRKRKWGQGIASVMAITRDIWVSKLESQTAAMEVERGIKQLLHFHSFVVYVSYN